MKNLKLAHLTLEEGTSQKINRRVVSLVCNEGTAWVTKPGDQRDYILRRGETLRLSSARGPIVVSSVAGHARVDVFSA